MIVGATGGLNALGNAGEEARVSAEACGGTVRGAGAVGPVGTGDLTAAKC